MDFAIVALFLKDIEREIQNLKEEISNKFGSETALSWMPHLTLRRGFDVPEDKIDYLVDEFSKFLKNIKTIEINLKGFKFIDDYPVNAWIKSPYIVAINITSNEIQKFHKKLNEFTLYNCGEEKEYAPHVTLAYSDLNETSFNKIKKYLANKQINHEIQLDNVALILNKEDRHTVYKKFDLYQK